MGNKRRGKRTTRRTWRETEVRSGYTTDKKVDISKLKFPNTKPAASADRPRKDSKSD